MSSKRAVRRRQCTGKRGYNSLLSAFAAQRGHAETFGEVLEAYQCCFCHRYHLGHPRAHAKSTRQNFKTWQYE